MPLLPLPCSQLIVDPYSSLTPIPLPKGIATIEFGNVVPSVVLGTVLGKFTLIALAVLVSRGLGARMPGTNATTRAGVVAMLSTNSNDIAFGLPLVTSLYTDAYSLGSQVFTEHLYVFSAVQTCVLLPIMLFVLEAGKMLSLVGKEEGESEEAGQDQGREHSERLACHASSDARPGRSSWCRLLLGVFRRLLMQPVVVSIILGLLCNVVFKIVLDQALPGLVLQIVDILAGAFLLCSLLQAGMALVGRTEVLTQEKGLLVPLFFVAAKSCLLPVLCRYYTAALLATFPSKSLTNSETSDLVDFAFVVNTVPSATASVVILSSYISPSQGQDTLWASVILNILASGPLMFLTVSFVTVDADGFAGGLTSFKEVSWALHSNSRTLSLSIRLFTPI